MMIGRQRQAVLLAAYSHSGRPVSAGLLAEAQRNGLTQADLRAILNGDVPRDRELAVVVAASWLVVDRSGQLDSTDIAELQAVGLGPMALADLAGLAMAAMA